MLWGASPVSAQAPADTVYTPNVIFTGMPRTYQIAGISVEGADNYDDFIIIGYSGLKEGEWIDIPGSELTAAAKRLWRQTLFSNVQILVDKVAGDQAWITLKLRTQPRISDVNYYGVKKGEQNDLQEMLQFHKGNQITQNIVNRAEAIIRKYYADKGFGNASVKINLREDLSGQNEMIVDINVNKNDKVKVHKIYIEGNEVMSDNALQRTMKKTNEKGKLLNLFKQKKFVETDYRDDLKRIIDKYNEKGYRDAKIVADSVVPYDEKTVDVHITVDEGKKYYINDISWVGNTIFPTDLLNDILGIKKGDVYNQKLLNKRTSEDDDAVANLYLNRGYLFYNLVPIERNVRGDSIDLEMRMMEGPQARINNVIINGNDRLYEKVIRRELRVKPGELFNKDDLMRSAREIAQTGHFNPENMDIRPEPNESDGTVDIVFNLESKANDKVQLSFGWGQTGITGQLALSFSNFSMKNLFNPSAYKGIIPRGDGQTFSISAQTNAKYYQSYGISFFDPWIGGSRPNSLSISADYSRSTGINNDFYSKRWANAYQNAYYYGGYGYNYNNNYDYYQDAYDPNKVLQTAGVSVGFGTRLSWPDDYFQFQAMLSYRWYYLKDWWYISPVFQNGTSNAITLGLNLSRTSIDNPIYTRRGSSFNLNFTCTPPANLFGRKNWAKLSEMANDENLSADQRQDATSQMYRWLDYWKLTFKSKTFTPLTDPDGKWTLVFMTRADFGIIGSWTKHLKTPFETYYFGGDGMSGGYTYATETIAMRGYENGQFTPSRSEGYAYAKYTFELHFPFLLQPSTTIYAIAFAEAGNCWTTAKAFNPFDLKRSAGVGARVYLSVLGFLGIDWAYGFDKVWGTRGGSQIHFVLGQEF